MCPELLLGVLISPIRREHFCYIKKGFVELRALTGAATQDPDEPLSSLSPQIVLD